MAEGIEGSKIYIVVHSRLDLWGGAHQWGYRATGVATGVGRKMEGFSEG
ncbi:MAG: hypothetical protein QW290_07055 [Sulfolobales archaeon]